MSGYAPAGTGISFHINEAGLRHLTQVPSGDVGRWLFGKMQTARNRAVRNAPVRTGRLRSSITVTLTESSRGAEAILSCNVEYATWVHEGRGPVRPVRAKALHWIAADGTEVFRRYAGPSKPNPFLLSAVEETF